MKKKQSEPIYKLDTVDGSIEIASIRRTLEIFQTENINLNPDCQRQLGAWKLATQMSFIQSILNGHFLATFHIVQGPFGKMLCDGQHRYHVINEFIYGTSLPIPQDLQSLYENQFYFRHLSPEAKSLIIDKPGMVQIQLHNVDSYENAVQLFIEINSGKPLNDFDIRTAYPSALKSFFKSLYGDPHCSQVHHLENGESCPEQDKYALYKMGEQVMRAAMTIYDKSDGLRESHSYSSVDLQKMYDRYRDEIPEAVVDAVLYVYKVLDDGFANTGKVGTVGDNHFKQSIKFSRMVTKLILNNLRNNGVTPAQFRDWYLGFQFKVVSARKPNDNDHKDYTEYLMKLDAAAAPNTNLDVYKLAVKDWDKAHGNRNSI